MVVLPRLRQISSLEKDARILSHINKLVRRTNSAYLPRGGLSPCEREIAPVQRGCNRPLRCAVVVQSAVEDHAERAEQDHGAPGETRGDRWS